MGKRGEDLWPVVQIIRSQRTRDGQSPDDPIKLNMLRGNADDTEVVPPSETDCSGAVNQF